MPTNSTVDPTRCPLCGQANQCAMEVERTTGDRRLPCWCTLQTFERELFDQLPDEARGKACICPVCAQGCR